MTEKPTKTVHEAEIVQALRSVYDPELPVNIYDLGLIYRIEIDDDRRVRVTMTLTTAGCPAAEFLPAQVRQAVREVEGVKDAEIELTFDPPYHRDMMSEEAKMELGFYF